jgi:hypothetical protein
MSAQLLFCVSVCFLCVLLIHSDERQCIEVTEYCVSSNCCLAECVSTTFMAPSCAFFSCSSVDTVHFASYWTPLYPSGHYMYHHIWHSTIPRSAPHSVFMCFVRILEQTAIISLYSINWLVCVTEMEIVYCAVRTKAFFLWRSGPTSVIATPFVMFPDRTQRRTTVSRTALYEWSFMPPSGFEPTVSTGERPMGPASFINNSA